MPLTVADIRKLIFECTLQWTFWEIFDFVSKNPPKTLGRESTTKLPQKQPSPHALQGCEVYWLQVSHSESSRPPFLIEQEFPTQHRAAEKDNFSMGTFLDSPWIFGGVESSSTWCGIGSPSWCDQPLDGFQGLLLEGWRSVSRRSPHQSYKCNNPAQWLIHVS